MQVKSSAWQHLTSLKTPSSSKRISNVINTWCTASQQGLDYLVKLNKCITCDPAILGNVLDSMSDYVHQDIHTHTASSKVQNLEITEIPSLKKKSGIYTVLVILYVNFEGDSDKINI